MMTATEAMEVIVRSSPDKDLADLRNELMESQTFRKFIMDNLTFFMTESLEAGPGLSLPTSLAYLSTLYAVGILHGIKMASPDIEAIR